MFSVFLLVQNLLDDAVRLPDTLFANEGQVVRIDIGKEGEDADSALRLDLVWNGVHVFSVLVVQRIHIEWPACLGRQLVLGSLLVYSWA